MFYCINPKRIFLSIFLIFLISFNSYADNKVTLQLNWKYQFEFAGYIAAKEKGFYKKAGLNVVIKEYNGGSVLNDVLSGKADFGVADSEIFASMILNKPVVLLANLFKRSPLVLATKPSIMTPLQLKNKKIMSNENEFKFTSLGLLLQKFHIKLKDIMLVKNSYSLKPFIEGKVDAVAIYITNQPYKLNKLHVKYNIIDPSNYGIFTYSGNLFTSKKELDAHPEIVKRFVDATIKGWEYALKHKKEIVNLIYNKYSKQKSIKALAFEANAIENVMMPDVFPVGYIDRNIVKEIACNFKDIMNIKRHHIKLDNFLYKPSYKSLLSKEELDFINKHRMIKICTNPDWTPIEYLSDGKAKGISIGVLKKIHQITGLNFVRVPTNSWVQSQKFLKEKKCDLLPSAIETKKRDEYALFTKPYMHYELFIFAKNDKEFVNGIDMLLDKPMTRKRGSGLISKLKKTYHKINIIETDSFKEAFEYVQKGKAYYTVATLPVASYYIKKYGFKDIVIIGDSGIRYDLRMAIRNDMPMLVDILNKGLSEISKSDIDKIYSRQINSEATKEYKHTILKILIIVSVVLFVFSLIIYFVNRTNQKLRKTKDMLEESLNNIEILINSTIQMIIICKDGICIDANDVTCKILGYEKSELIGKRMLDLFSDKYKAIVSKKMKEEHIQPYEVEFVRKDGSIVYAFAKSDYITINKEKVRVGSAVNITEIKRLQQELNELNRTLEKRIEEEIKKNRLKDNIMMQQSKLASMGELLSMIAHQWRQPLNTISATVNSVLLRIELGNYDEQFVKEKLDSMREYIKHLSNTIDDFRNFFRPDKEKENVCVDNLITNILKITKEHIESKNIKIVMNLNCNREIYTYPNELKHVILNLINNARDALIDRKVENPLIEIETKEENDKIIIFVRDNAGGIEESILDKIFEPYFSTKSKKDGTGLGLYMSKIIVEKHIGGKIEVKNVKDGAEFKVILSS